MTEKWVCGVGDLDFGQGVFLRRVIEGGIKLLDRLTE
jgi:hypothetical protein